MFNLDRRFALTAHHTNIRTEVIAGVTTFMTMAYIIFVQPTVLGAAGMDPGAVLTATCLSTALATALMALLANYPDRHRARDGPQLLLRVFGRHRDEGALAGGARAAWPSPEPSSS